MSERVELHPAWEWTCDNCGRNSFASSIVPDLSDEQRHDVAVQSGAIESWQTLDDLPPGETIDLQTYPDVVTCQHCGADFETVDPDGEYDAE